VQQKPPIYNQPMIIPAQAIEDRNRPHGRRAASFLNENVRTLNEPVGRIQTKKVDNKDEKRWWEWNMKLEQNPDWKKKRSNSSIHREMTAGSTDDNYRTTYMQEHNSTQNIITPSTKVGLANENQGAASMHTYNPNTKQANGIVPVNDLNGFTRNGEEQRVFVDKMSFEQGYDARSTSNYPNRGKVKEKKLKILFIKVINNDLPIIIASGCFCC
jgi:hypothetical protein